ncbi:MAG: hypothetical protein ACPGVG_10360 [Mycobacterium sp.]
MPTLLDARQPSGFTIQDQQTGVLTETNPATQRASYATGGLVAGKRRTP